MLLSDQNDINIYDTRTFEEVCIDAQLSLQAGADNAHNTSMLAYYPKAKRNPFQDMLYSEGHSQGYACFPMRQQTDPTKPVNDMPFYIHYHWVHRAFASADDRQEASRAAKQFLENVDAQKEAGFQILWTIHNLISHESRFPEEEIELRAGLSARADHVHIMNPATREICAQYYPIKGNKVFMVAHPSYAGVYGDFISPAQARLNLGIAPHEKTILLFGSMGPQKGTRQLLNDVPAIEKALGDKLRVIVAGSPAEPAYMEDIYKLAAENPNVLLIDQHIDDQMVQTLFRATNITVCPYDVGLNSGVAATAATYACPAVVPDILVPAMYGAETGMIGFNPKDRATLVPAIIRAFEIDQNSSVRSSLSKWAVDNHPRLNSREFFTALRARS